MRALAGFSALAFAGAIGPRRGFGAATFEPHNIPYTVLGAGLLWVGWFGFHGGSALASDGVAVPAAFAFGMTYVLANGVRVLTGLRVSKNEEEVGLDISSHGERAYASTGEIMTKKIEAYIREEKLEDVKQALHEIGIVGMNVVEVRGHGRQGGIALAWRTGTYKVDLLPRYQVNIVLSDHKEEKTIETICQAASTGEVGDGIIFVYPVEDVIRIRTRERGHEALMYPDGIDVRPARSEPAPG